MMEVGVCVIFYFNYSFDEPDFWRNNSLKFQLLILLVKRNAFLQEKGFVRVDYRAEG